MNHWLISALGAGWGHINRAIALGRHVAQWGRVHILTNSPYARWIQTQIPLVESPHVAAHLHLHSLDCSSIESVRHEVGAIALSQSWTGVIIDTFPRGLVGEWVDLLPHVTQHYPHCHHILIQRDLNPSYLHAKQVPTFIHQHYHHILLPGEGMDGIDFAAPKSPLVADSALPTFPTSAPKAPAPPTSFTFPLTVPGISAPLSPRSAKRSSRPVYSITAPWLMRSAAELPDKAGGRLSFSLLDQPLIVVCAAGNPSELDLFGRLTMQLTEHCPNAQVRCLAFECPPHCPPALWIRHWPGMELLQLADVVIGGGGYNTVYECAALGIPLVAFSFDRRYDRQHRRLQRYGYLVKTVEEVIAVTQLLLTQIEGVKGERGRSRLAAPCDRPTYENGVSQAVEILTQK